MSHDRTLDLLRQVMAGVFETRPKGNPDVYIDDIRVLPFRGMFRALALLSDPEPRNPDFPWRWIMAYGRTPEWAARCLGHRIGRVG